MVVLLLAGCGTMPAAVTETRPDGTIALKCKAPLPRCLDQAEQACLGTRYEVVHATDNHDYYGPSSVGMESETRSSEAVIRCGTRGRSLFGGTSPGTPPPDAPVPAPGPASRACVPGATQTCVGAGACQGGQACLPDGSGFGPCACVPPPPATDAGAAP